MDLSAILVLFSGFLANFAAWRIFAPGTESWAIASGLTATFSLFIFFRKRPGRGLISRVLATTAFQFAVGLSFGTAYAFAKTESLGFWHQALWVLILGMQVLICVAILIRSGETAEYKDRGTVPMPRPPIPGGGGKTRMVSIHLACCNEPPEVVIASLDSLARLNYPFFEVLVVDNNTDDPSLWKPVEAHCRHLGSRFRFFTLGARPGFKAGALNFALEKTDPEAQLVGIVDADWLVEPDWLECSVAYFDDPNVGSVQGAQSYRDRDASLFKRMENDECIGPYQLALAQRDLDNASPLLGAMVLLDRRALEEVGGWNEKIIGEDIELGLRILNHRKRGIYLAGRVLGQGLLPEDFAAFIRQRQRWCYGALLVLRLHREILKGREGNLNPAQRHHFVMEWFNLCGFAFYPIFLALAFAGAALVLAKPEYRDLPTNSLLLSALLLVAIHFLNLGWVFGSRMGVGKGRVFLMILTKLSLIYPVSKAVWKALLKRPLAFLRTDRHRKKSSLWTSLQPVAGSIQITAIFLLLAAMIFASFGISSPHAWLLSLCLGCAAIPCLSAIAVNAISYFSNRRKEGSTILGVPEF